MSSTGALKCFVVGAMLGIVALTVLAGTSTVSQSVGIYVLITEIAILVPTGIALFKIRQRVLEQVAANLRRGNLPVTIDDVVFPMAEVAEVAIPHPLPRPARASGLAREIARVQSQITAIELRRTEAPHLFTREQSLHFRDLLVQLQHLQAIQLEQARRSQHEQARREQAQENLETEELGPDLARLVAARAEVIATRDATHHTIDKEPWYHLLGELRLDLKALATRETAWKVLAIDAILRRLEYYEVLDFPDLVAGLHATINDLPQRVNVPTARVRWFPLTSDPILAAAGIRIGALTVSRLHVQGVRTRILIGVWAGHSPGETLIRRADVDCVHLVANVTLSNGELPSDDEAVRAVSTENNPALVAAISPGVHQQALVMYVQGIAWEGLGNIYLGSLSNASLVGFNHFMRKQVHDALAKVAPLTCTAWDRELFCQLVAGDSPAGVASDKMVQDFLLYCQNSSPLANREVANFFREVNSPLFLKVLPTYWPVLEGSLGVNDLDVRVAKIEALKQVADNASLNPGVSTSVELHDRRTGLHGVTLLDEDARLNDQFRRLREAVRQRNLRGGT